MALVFSVGIFLTWLACAAVAGVLLWHLFALLIVPELPARVRNPIGGLFQKMTMWVYDGAFLVQRLDGSFDLVPWDESTDHDSFVFHLGGERREVDDPTNAMGALSRRKFGLVLDGVGSVLPPWALAVGEDERAKVADGGHKKVLKDANSGENVLAYNPYTPVDDRTRVVDMRSIMSVLAQCADTDLAERIQERVKASEAGYGGMSDLKLLLVAAASLGAGIGITWLLLRQGGSGGQVTATIAPTLSMLGVG